MCTKSFLRQERRVYTVYTTYTRVMWTLQYTCTENVLFSGKVVILHPAIQLLKGK